MSLLFGRTCRHRGATGTVLDPLLFLCHINDFPETVTSQVRLFTDDCLLYRPIRCHQDHVDLQDLNLEK